MSSSVEDGTVVYRMLETTRVFALDRLSESSELERVSLRHGLGLHIVKEIVTAHGGSISVQSSAVGGTTFCVALPRRIDDAAPLARAKPRDDDDSSMNCRAG